MPGPFERRILRADPIPQSDRRWLYRLSCGHSVNRRQNAAKRMAHCGHCETQGARHHV